MKRWLILALLLCPLAQADNLGSWAIDDGLTFGVQTHSPSTGDLADADSVPTYRVYEDETGTAILNGSMAKLDDTNTTGFYSEQLTLSAANGFERGKSYTIYIAGTVESVTGGKSHNFQIGAATDVVYISGDSTAANNLELAADGTGYNLGSGSIVAASVTGNVGGNVTGSVGSVTAGVTLVNDAITAAKIAADAIGASELAATATAEMGGGVWGYSTAGAFGLDTFGQAFNAMVSTVGDAFTAADAANTKATAIQTQTDKLADLTEDDGGTARFTTNALEQGPSGGDVSDQILALLLSDPEVPEGLTWLVTRRNSKLSGGHTIVLNEGDDLEVCADFGLVLGTNEAITSVTAITLEGGTGLTLSAFDAAEVEIVGGRWVKFRVSDGTGAEDAYEITLSVETNNTPNALNPKLKLKVAD